MKVDLNIINGKIWTNKKLVNASISIDKGKIVIISDKKYLPKSKEVIDAKDCLVLPGMIDSHIHSRDPGFTEREDFYTVSCAAAAGGITTIFDMPNNIPPASTTDGFKIKIEIANRKSIIDFALYAGAGKENISEIEFLSKLGAIAFKTFLLDVSTSKTKDTYWGINISNNTEMLKVFEAINKTGKISAVHAEDGNIINYAVEKLKAEKRNDVSAFGESRPEISEIVSTHTVILLANYTGTKLHICHVGSPGVIDLIYEAKQKNQDVTSETTPLYLLLSEEDLERIGYLGYIYPPLRSLDVKKKIYDAFIKGKIDILNSDHAPYTKEEMKKGERNVWDAAPDGSAIEIMLPLMLNEVNKGIISLERVVHSLSEFPAKRFGIDNQKGFIEIGLDADFVIVDMHKEKIIYGENMKTKQKITQFEGVKIKGVPIKTISKGKVIAEDSEIMVEPGWGEFIKPN